MDERRLAGGKKSGAQIAFQDQEINGAFQQAFATCRSSEKLSAERGVKMGFNRLFSSEKP
jgi:hypothetical protein